MLHRNGARGYEHGNSAHEKKFPTSLLLHVHVGNRACTWNSAHDIDAYGLLDGGWEPKHTQQDWIELAFSLSLN